MPYDPPSAAAWMNGSHGTGYAGDQGGRHRHLVRRRGVWAATATSRRTPTIAAYHAFEIAEQRQRNWHDLLTVSLGGKGSITHIINDTGATAQGTATVPVNLVSFP